MHVHIVALEMLLEIQTDGLQNFPSTAYSSLSFRTHGTFAGRVSAVVRLSAFVELLKHDVHLTTIIVCGFHRFSDQIQSSSDYIPVVWYRSFPIYHPQFLFKYIIFVNISSENICF
ncbi:unnamed protein product, partial [Cuscuta epithymum]